MTIRMKFCLINYKLKKTFFCEKNKIFDVNICRFIFLKNYVFIDAFSNVVAEINFFNAICFVLQFTNKSSIDHWFDELFNFDINRINFSVSIKITFLTTNKRNHVK